MKQYTRFLIFLVILISCKKNTPPTASLVVDPVFGDTETLFLFDASGSSDAESSNDLLQFRWDWEGDSVWDTGFANGQTSQHQYGRAGVFMAVVEVMDEDQLTSRDSVEINVAEPNTPPIADFIVAPDSGNIHTMFVFDPGRSTDKETPHGDLMCRWDWESDSIWDDVFMPLTTSRHWFTRPGIYQTTMEIRDGNGSTSTVSHVVKVYPTGDDGFLIDLRDNRVYTCQTIGKQDWMAENLAYLPSVNPSDVQSSTEPYFYVYGYEGSNISKAKATVNFKTYGVLYNWYAALNGSACSNAVPSGVQGICPPGWHLPGDAEWIILESELGMVAADNTWEDRKQGSVGGKLKEAGTSHWMSPNKGATNETGFAGLPGGGFWGNFGNLGMVGFFWTASLSDQDWSARIRRLHYFTDGVYRGDENRKWGFSVRCLKD